MISCGRVALGVCWRCRHGVIPRERRGCCSRFCLHLHVQTLVSRLCCELGLPCWQMSFARENDHPQVAMLMGTG